MSWVDEIDDEHEQEHLTWPAGAARYRDIRSRVRAAAEAQHARDHGRRHRLLEHQRLQPRHDGLSHTQHRPHRQRGGDLYRLLRAAIVHCRPRRVHHRTESVADRTSESRPGGRERRIVGERPDHCRAAQAAGYVAGQFGKNHLGDRNEFLPTVHGFDEFFGNLYHLNAEDEPEHPDYPKNPAFRAQFGPRGVMRCVATTTDTPDDDPRFGPWGKQRCEDTGPLTKKRMETIDEGFLNGSIDFIDRANGDKKPFFVWFNPSRMHIWTRLKPESQGKTGLGIYPDGMVEHDGQVGQLLKKLDDLGIANNTVVIYTTDNGAETF